jgi:hypothetical protein
MVDETKHTPKPDERVVVIDPFATAAIRLLLLTGSAPRNPKSPRESLQQARHKRDDRVEDRLKQDRLEQRCSVSV